MRKLFRATAMVLAFIGLISSFVIHQNTLRASAQLVEKQGGVENIAASLAEVQKDPQKVALELNKTISNTNLGAIAPQLDLKNPSIKNQAIEVFEQCVGFCRTALFGEK